MAYIRSAKGLPTRVTWGLILSVGFFLAGYNINLSVSAWKESPFVTSVDILPISQLPIPDFIICPPPSLVSFGHDLHDNGMTVGAHKMQEELKKMLISTAIHRAVNDINEQAKSFGSLNLMGFDEVRVKECGFLTASRSVVFSTVQYFASFGGTLVSSAYKKCTYEFVMDNPYNENLVGHLFFESIDLNEQNFFHKDQISVEKDGTVYRKWTGRLHEDRIHLEFPINQSSSTVAVNYWYRSERLAKGFLATWNVTNKKVKKVAGKGTKSNLDNKDSACLLLYGASCNNYRYLHDSLAIMSTIMTFDNIFNLYFDEKLSRLDKRIEVLSVTERIKGKVSAAGQKQASSAGNITQRQVMLVIQLLKWKPIAEYEQTYKRFSKWSPGKLKKLLLLVYIQLNSPEELIKSLRGFLRNVLPKYEDTFYLVDLLELTNFAINSSVLIGMKKFFIVWIFMDIFWNKLEGPSLQSTFY